MTDVLLPPDIVPTTEDVELVDEGTALFVPELGGSVPQRNQFYEPYLKVTQTWKSLRQSDRARMLAAVNRLQGKYNTLRAVAGYAERGSFDSAEKLGNPTFANSATGWSSFGGSFTVGVQERVLRSTYAFPGANGTVLSPSSATNVAAYLPHLVGAHFLPTRQTAVDTCRLWGGVSVGDSSLGAVASSPAGLIRAPFVPSTGTLWFQLQTTLSSGPMIGDYFDTSWTTVQRCALADNGVNLLTFSDQLDNAAWTKTGCSVSANQSAGLDGTITADALTEDASSGTHGLSQAVTVPTNAEDITLCVMVRRVGAARDWVALQLTEATGGSTAIAYFNLNTGAVGTLTAGANWTAVRAYMHLDVASTTQYRISIVARKTNGATSITCALLQASANGTISYAGNSATNSHWWRATAAVSGSPVRLTQTTTVAAAGSNQTGNGLYVRGLGSAAAVGVVLLGDTFEVGGELKQLRSSVSCDGLGLGYLEFGPSLFRSPADGDPVVLGTTLNRFMLVDNPKWSNQYGQYADLTLSFRAIYE